MPAHRAPSTQSAMSSKNRHDVVETPRASRSLDRPAGRGLAAPDHLRTQHDVDEVAWH